MLTEKQLQAQGGVLLQATPATENRATAPISMDAFYAQPITLESFMGNAHNAQAQTATTAKRTRQGTNQHYQAVLGTLRPTAVCQLCGDAGLTIAQAGQVMGLLGWHTVNPATVATATRDGATHGYKKDGGVYKDYKVPAIKARLTAEQIAVLQDAILFVQTAPAGV